MNKKEMFIFSCENSGTLPLLHMAEQSTGGQTRKSNIHYKADSKPDRLFRSYSLQNDLQNFLHELMLMFRTHWLQRSYHFPGKIKVNPYAFPLF